MSNIPRWCWWIISVVIVLIVFVLLKVNVQIGINGFHLTQGLVH
jgi:hypothetical protein